MTAAGKKCAGEKSRPQENITFVDIAISKIKNFRNF